MAGAGQRTGLRVVGARVPAWAGNNTKQIQGVGGGAGTGQGGACGGGWQRRHARAAAQRHPPAAVQRDTGAALWGPGQSQRARGNAFGKRRPACRRAQGWRGLTKSLAPSLIPSQRARARARADHVRVATRLMTDRPARPRAPPRTAPDPEPEPSHEPLPPPPEAGDDAPFVTSPYRLAPHPRPLPRRLECRACKSPPGASRPSCSPSATRCTWPPARTARPPSTWSAAPAWPPLHDDGAVLTPQADLRVEETSAVAACS